MYIRIILVYKYIERITTWLNGTNTTYFKMKQKNIIFEKYFGIFTYSNCNNFFHYCLKRNLNIFLPLLENVPERPFSCTLSQAHVLFSPHTHAVVVLLHWTCSHFSFRPLLPTIWKKTPKKPTTSKAWL